MQRFFILFSPIIFGNKLKLINAACLITSHYKVAIIEKQILGLNVGKSVYRKSDIKTGGDESSQGADPGICYGLYRGRGNVEKCGTGFRR